MVRFTFLLDKNAHRVAVDTLYSFFLFTLQIYKIAFNTGGTLRYFFLILPRIQIFEGFFSSVTFSGSK